MNNYCTFYIVRHAQSEANKKGLRGGQTDFAISEEGILEAKERAKDLSSISFDAVFSSDLVRAQKTAEIIALRNKLIVETTKILRERAWGSKLEGLTVEETEKYMGNFESMSKEERYKIKLFEDMESDEEVISRFFTFLRETAIAYPGKTVLVVSHGNIMRTALVHLGMGTIQEFNRRSIKNTGYFVLRSGGSDFEVVKTVGIEKK